MVSQNKSPAIPFKYLFQLSQSALYLVYPVIAACSLFYSKSELLVRMKLFLNFEKLILKIFIKRVLTNR